MFFPPLHFTSSVIQLSVHKQTSTWFKHFKIMDAMTTLLAQVTDYRAAACSLQAKNLTLEAKILELQTEIRAQLIFIQCAFYPVIFMSFNSKHKCVVTRFIVLYLLFLLLVLRPFQDYFTHIEANVKRWAKTGVPGEKPPDLPMQNLALPTC